MKTIQVEMEVSEVRQIGIVVQVWGYVGDYMVCVVMPKEEAKQKGLL